MRLQAGDDIGGANRGVETARLRQLQVEHQSEVDGQKPAFMVLV
ncbi:MAG: hypothetical protein ACREJQ_05380 [bacterium]